MFLATVEIYRNNGITKIYVQHKKFVLDMWRAHHNNCSFCSKICMYVCIYIYMKNIKTVLQQYLNLNLNEIKNVLYFIIIIIVIKKKLCIIYYVKYN